MKPPDPRLPAILDEISEGLTLADVGAGLGLSKQRIHQLLARANQQELAAARARGLAAWREKHASALQAWAALGGRSRRRA